MPNVLRALIREAWDDDPKKRPTMKRFAAVLRGELKSLSTDDSVLNRTMHMNDRSNHSQHMRRQALSSSLHKQEDDHRIFDSRVSVIPNHKGTFSPK
jgi:serine/threonine protein phosphatase PrpC